MDAQLRYLASTALAHPWITRDFKAPIPLTVYEMDLRNQLKSELNNPLRTLLFIALTVEHVL